MREALHYCDCCGKRVDKNVCHANVMVDIDNFGFTDAELCDECFCRFIEVTEKYVNDTREFLNFSKKYKEDVKYDFD